MKTFCVINFILNSRYQKKVLMKEDLRGKHKQAEENNNWWGEVNVTLNRIVIEAIIWKCSRANNYITYCIPTPRFTLI